MFEESLFEEESYEEDESAVIRVNARELVGGLQILTNEPSFYTIRAGAATKVAIMKKKDFSLFLEAHPEIYLPVAHSVLRRLSPFLRGVDFALDWVLVDSGHACYRAGDLADSLFVVLSGRLRSVEKKTVVEEFGRGDVLGMMEVLTKKPRSTTVLAVRFSQLARVPEGLLNFIKMQYPQ
uniref:Cyclic nucleotide-binding domain-containing protein n=1 Tax=Caenorhabditis japonica TaxID=281687 RepID=A0A8R1I4N9_CAEJA